jgi:hypothetical protein
MPGSPNTSFIPKHTPNKIERRNSPRQLFIGTIIVRVLFFSVLIAAIGVFAYDRKLSSELDKEVEAFKAATSSFEQEEEKVQEVISMDRRLTQANDRFKNSISIATIFGAFEKTTIKTVQLENLNIIKKSDTEVSVEADVMTDTFDSVIFQRSIFEANEVLQLTEFEDVTVERNIEGGEISADNLSLSAVNPTVSFKAIVTIDPKTIPVVSIDKAAKAQVVPATVPAVVDNDTPSVEIKVASPENL